MNYKILLFLIFVSFGLVYIQYLKWSEDPCKKLVTVFELQNPEIMCNFLRERVDRENYWSDIDEKAGYPRRFGKKIHRDHYIRKAIENFENNHKMAD